MHPNGTIPRRAGASDALPDDPLPPPSSPEEAFLAWLLWLPPERDPHRAAHAELERLDGRAYLAPPVRRLRELFAALAEGEPGPREGTDARSASALPRRSSRNP